MQYFKALSAIAAWTVAVTVAVQADSPGDWGLTIFIATAACVPTFWLMIEATAQVTRAVLIEAVAEAIHDERERTEQLVEAVALRFAIEEAERDVPRLMRY